LKDAFYHLARCSLAAFTDVPENLAASIFRVAILKMEEHFYASDG
jgi:hypothetical protein